MRSITTRSVFAPAVRAPAPAPTLSPLTARSDPSFRGRGSSLGRVTGPPAFVEFPVVLQNVPGPVLFSKVGPWKRTELLSAVCGPVQSVRPIQNGKFLIGCHSEGQQGKLSRCQSLPGAVGIQCRIPVPTVEGVIGPIPLGEWALKQIKTDLLGDGHRVAVFFFD